MEESEAGSEDSAAQCVEPRQIEGRRWLDGGYLASNIAIVTEEVAAISNKQLIKFIFLRSGKSRLYEPGAGSDGVGALAGREELGVLAWSERCVRPRVLVYQYNDPGDLKVLAPAAALEYRSLAFSHQQFLLGVTGVPDFLVNLWDWQTESLLTSETSGFGGPGSSLVRTVQSSFPPGIVQNVG